jgi:hypothetical protein
METPRAQTGSNVTIAVVRKSDLRTGTIYEQWSDPTDLARMTPEKVAVILSNPMSRNEDEPVQLIGLARDQVAGRVDLLAGDVIMEGETHPVRWASGLAVAPEMRRTLIGLKLLREMQFSDAVAAAFGPSQMAHPIYKGFKWTDFVMPRYILLRRSRSVIERKLSVRAARVAAGPVDAFLALYTRLALRNVGRAVDVRTDTNVPPELEAAIRCSANTFMPRSVQTLNWRLKSSFHPHPRDRNLLLTIAERGGVVGYALLKIRFYPLASHRGFRNVLLGSLQEWLIFDAQRLHYRTLTALACRELLRHDVDAIEVCASSEREEQILRHMGMRRVGDVHLMWRPAPGTRLTSPQCQMQSRWLIRHGDGDGYFF